MNTRMLLVVLFALAGCTSAAKGDQGTVVIASVVRVDHPAILQLGAVGVEMMVHAPTQLVGTTFLLLTASPERAEVRAIFPTGSLHTFNMPKSTTTALTRQLKAMAGIERTLDSGVNPMVISQAVTLPTVKIGDLSESPEAFIVRP